MAAVEPLYGMTKGIPTDAALYSVSWPFKDHAEIDDLDGGDIGLVYCLPIIPSSGRQARFAMDIVEEICSKYGAKPYTTLNLMGNSLETVITLAFDKRVDGEAGKAHACNRELHEALKAEGYLPYRVGINLMDQVIDPDDEYWHVIRKIKKALDPNEIISPGRYCLGKE